jgi:3-oxoacyl-ACP reductase-like protein
MSLLRTAARVGVASSVHGRVQRRQSQRWVDQAAAAAAPAPAAPAPEVAAPGTPAAGPRLEQLRLLGELRAGGVLTEAEFAAEKARILAP